MNAFVTIIAVVACAVVAQTILPDRALWHEGSYSVALVAAVAFLAVRTAALARSAPRAARAGILCIASGAGVLAIAAVASGLLAPDPQSVVGTPGSMVDTAGLGAVAFPPLQSGAPPALVRGGRAFPIRGERYVGAFLLRTTARTVVAVDAADRAGLHLTVTQPTGPAFSSPVLLMTQQQRIGGLDLPYDAFSLPAAKRIVKVVLFSAAQVALMRGISGPPQPMLLFAVDDETDQPLAHAIRLARSGQTVEAGGVRLRGEIERYPAVDVYAVPSLIALAVGFALIAAGGALAIRTRLRS